MSTPIRKHFKHNGRPKRKFTEAGAKRHALQEKKDAYRCDFCGAWHVGGRKGS